VVQEGESVCARGQAGDRTDGGWKRASYCIDAYALISIDDIYFAIPSIDRTASAMSASHIQARMAAEPWLFGIATCLTA